MKKLYESAIANGSVTFQLPKGQYGLMALMFSGTIPASDTTAVALSDLGNVILNWNGDSIINVDAEYLNLKANLYGGVSQFASTAGNGSSTKGTFSAIIMIPTGLYFDRANIYDIGQNDKVSFKLDFPLLTAKADGGTVQILAKPRNGVMNYLNRMLSRPINLGGAGDSVDQITGQNFASLYFKNPTMVDNFQIERNGVNRVDCSKAVLQDYSDWLHQLETTSTLIGVEFCESGSVNESYSRSLNFKYHFTTSGTLAQYYDCVQFTPEKASESALNAQAAL